jgi:hypothetical protein
MKPLRFFLPLSTFLMRAGVAFYVYIIHFHQVLELNYRQFDFYLSLTFSIFGILLLFGAFTRKQTLTVLSSLILLILGLYEIFTFTGNYFTTGFVSTLFFILIALFFLCNGNKSR